MSWLNQRRRALMMATKGAGEIIYQLPQPVTHSGKSIFDTGVNLLARNDDWSAFIDLSITVRECYILANGASGTYQTSSTANNQVASDVYNNGGFCLTKGTFAGQYGTNMLVNNSVLRFGASYPWDYTGRIKAVMVHNKAAKSITVYLSYGGTTYSKQTIIYTTYPVGSALNLTTYYRGTLNNLTIYGKALSASECENLVIGGAA